MGTIKNEGGYQPPKNYKRVEALPTAAISEAVLSGKELWLLRVPDSMKTSQLDGLEIDLSQLGKASATPIATLSLSGGRAFAIHESKDIATNGAVTSVVTQDNTEQGYTGGQEMRELMYLAPSEASPDQLTIVEQPVTRFLSLVESVDIPDFSKLTEEIRTRPRPKRPQPKDLRMRFKPYGFSSGDPPVTSAAPVVSRVSKKSKHKSKKSKKH